MTEAENVRTFKLRNSRMKFKDMYSRIKRMAESKRDATVKANKLYVEAIAKENDEEFFHDFELDVPPMETKDGEIVELGVLPLTDTAKLHLYQKLEIPTRFAQRLLVKGHGDALGHTISKLLQDYAERDKESSRMSTKLMVRTVEDMDGQRIIRNVGTEYTRTLDNYDVVQATMVQLAKLGLSGSNIDRCDLTPYGDNLYMVVLNPELKAEIPRVGDWVEGGFILQNSDTGLGSLRFDMFAKILSCNNGTISNIRWRKVHRGSRLDEGITSNTTKLLQDMTIFSYVQDLIKKAFDGTNWDTWVNKMNRATEVVVDEPTLAFENVTAKFQLPQEMENDLVNLFSKSECQSQWDLAQAVTNQAQKVSTISKQIEMERVGSQILEMSERDFIRFITGKPSRFGRRVVEAEIVA